MTPPFEIRESVAEDLPALEALYPEAFPEEDLLPLVRALLEEPAGILSLVGLIDGKVAGHVIFTECHLRGHPGKLSLLGPLAVARALQRRGVGSALVRDGLERLRRCGTARVLVLGDPAYYGRFCFAPERMIAAPYRLPEEWADAWRSLPLGDGAPVLSGTLSVPPPWWVEDYWGA